MRHDSLKKLDVLRLALSACAVEIGIGTGSIVDVDAVDCVIGLFPKLRRLASLPNVLRSLVLIIDSLVAGDSATRDSGCSLCEGVR